MEIFNAEYNKQKVHVRRAYRAMLYMMATIFQLGFQLKKRHDSP
jgi:hypothetical protein